MSKPDNSSSPSTSTQSVQESLPASVDDQKRAELLAKARAFLQTPGVNSQDVAARREFLKEKGLSIEDAEQLISECPPPIPPRTYPRPAPSKLPIILYATFKLLLLLTGASVVSAAMYFTYIYPKLAASFGARAKLANHQTGLLKTLQGQTEKARQAQRASDFSSQAPPKEQGENPVVSVEDTTVSLEEGTTAGKTQDDSTPATVPKSDLELLQALRRLKDAIPRRKPTYAATLQDMSDMTALIASKMYAPKVHSPIEGEVRKELRAAKGLLLNRKTFTAVKSTPGTPV
ncbi:hypothetical protein M408DRAFT_330700 [Serendipita vermifera MAFF 305830]|uniref:Peroxisome membrane anchor protein Pex14p N-terminal domain-containing protein n=1 Tax=Serendipita vermifera MAFF 305830 TaxID=933852 RepID=A0A0C2WJ09_SERVB|nr:hypothetical protein M408DRAFT_330700 [Serendipita vermifera MAFF 305830]